MSTTPEEILDFWFGDSFDSPGAVAARTDCWFVQSDEFDRSIDSQFGVLPNRALRGEFDQWSQEPLQALALVLVLDQFPRNLYRGRARSFEFDPKARGIALPAIDAAFDQKLHPIEASFLYLPLEHSEDLFHQERSVELFAGLIPRVPSELRSMFEQFLDYARRHREVIRQFGRFPHRNAVLGRRSTSEELAYLESGGETFAGGRTEEGGRLTRR